MLTTAAVALCLAGQVAPTDLDVGTQPGELNTVLAHNDACRTCHFSDTETSMPLNTYRGTMMDLAGVDPIFLAALEIAYIDHAPASELCIRCHFPKGWLEGRGTGAPEDYFGLQEQDLIGVNCDFCHRMAVPPPIQGYTGTVPPPALSGIKIANSQVFVNDAQTKFGPLGTNVVVGHASQFSPLFGDSVLCAQCHDVSNTFRERLGLDGAGFGTPVPIERTYSEWQNSDYSRAGPGFKGCTDCHMKEYDGRAATPGNAPQRTGLHEHTLVGGNTVAPLMVAWLYSGADAPAYFRGLTADAERIVARAAEQLGQAADLEAMELVVTENQNYLRVRVTNQAGHKLPTGYAEGRRMFLGHEVVAADSTPILKTGTPNYSTWEFVVGEQPLKTYEILLGETPTEHSFHFVTVDKLIKDNRIPPAGFRPLPDTAPVGYTYPENPDGTLVNYDETDLPLGRDDCWPAIATVRLWFQATSGDYYRFLVENAPVFGPDLEAAWTAVGGGPPELMNEIAVAVFPDGRIEPAAGPYTCEPGPVYENPEPDPQPTPEPGPTPDVIVEPEPTPDPQPDVGPGFTCACATGQDDAAAFGVGALLVLPAVWVRRRRSRP